MQVAIKLKGTNGTLIEILFPIPVGFQTCFPNVDRLQIRIYGYDQHQSHSRINYRGIVQKAEFIAHCAARKRIA